jgi:hypothetical protein
MADFSRNQVVRSVVTCMPTGGPQMLVNFGSCLGQLRRSGGRADRDAID